MLNIFQFWHDPDVPADVRPLLGSWPGLNPTANYRCFDDALDSYAGLIEALGDDPDRTDLAWQLGVDKEVTDYSRRTIELRNFIQHLVKPMHQSRHRGHVVANSRPSA